MKKLEFVSIVMIFCFVFPLNLFAAQSSKDMSVTKQLKASMLEKILGQKNNTKPREPEYVLGVGDVVTVSILDEGDMSASYFSSTTEATGGVTQLQGSRVMPDGRISLRDIGDVDVVGLTLTELADYLKELYAVIYHDPIVTTTLLQSNSLRYTIMGEIQNPGVFQLEYPVTLVQVIARSAGFSEWAKKKITVVRENLTGADGNIFKNHTLKFDYEDFISGKSIEKNIVIHTGDIIIVH